MRPAHIRNTCILVCAVLSVAACSTTRRLGSDEVLYTGVKKIRIEPDSGAVSYTHLTLPTILLV